jgi:hypothetical protein
MMSSSYNLSFLDLYAMYLGEHGRKFLFYDFLKLWKILSKFIFLDFEKLWKVLFKIPIFGI